MENTETLGTRHGQINSRKRPSPWALVAGLTPGGAVGTGIFSLSVGFKKSKIEQELMNWEGSSGPGGHPLPPLTNVWLTS